MPDKWSLITEVNQKENLIPGEDFMGGSHCRVKKDATQYCTSVSTGYKEWCEYIVECLSSHLYHLLLNPSTAQYS